ncbi:MAG TPA: regulatory iron-sulfur-containing complex subunit RicT [Dictyoglomaceae bacterium]|nr:regulatory iron-sulfur-containing complex subunit RicT [Dictyoglomaceae bacterium]
MEESNKGYVVGIRLRSLKIYLFSTEDPNLNVGDWVIVKTVQGTEAGKVAISSFLPSEDFKPLSPLKPILRKATEEDLEKIKEYREKEKEILSFAQQKADALGLNMKMLVCEINFDYSKITIHFSSENRVDFRELVKELAAQYKTRIELHQIGIRDEVKYLGGLGICGREACCHLFLQEFESISVKMAKEQSLVLNPLKISGICGRLMCCLSYEYETYQSIKAELPPKGSIVETKQGKGVVVDHHVPLGKVIVEFEEERRELISPDEIVKVYSKEEKDKDKLLDKILKMLGEDQ